MHMVFKLNKWMLTGACLTFLVACNDDDDDKVVIVPVEPVITTVNIEGVVTDTPLQNAKVCMNCNGNLVCDADEIQARSQKDGKFTLEKVPEKDVKQCSLLAETTTDTIDESTQEPITKPYALKSFPECNIVSPITTMVNHHMNLGEKVEIAKTKVQRALASEIDPCTDHWAMKDDESKSQQQRDEAETMTQISDVFKAMMIKNMESMKSTLDKEDTKHEDVLDLVLNYQLSIDAMVTIVNEITNIQVLMIQGDTSKENKDEKGFYKRWLSQLSETELKMLFTLNPEAEEVFVQTEQMKLMEAKKNAQPLKISEHFLNANERLNGFTRFDDENSTDKFDLSYVSERVGHEDDENNKMFLSESVWSDGSFNADDFKAEFVVFTEDGWKRPGYVYQFDRDSITDETTDIKLNNVNVPSFSFKLSGKEYAVENRSIASFFMMNAGIDVWRQLFEEEELFHTDAKSLDMVARASEQYYIINHLERPSCEEGLQILTLCNSVKFLAPQNPRPDSETGKTEFELTHETSWNDINDLIENNNIPWMPIFHEDDNGFVAGFMKEDGSISFIQFPKDLEQKFYRTDGELVFESENGDIAPVVIASGTWKENVVFNRDFIELDLPNPVLRLNPDLNKRIFFRLHAEVIRIGNLMNGNQVLSEGMVRLNAIGRDTVLNRYSVDKVQALIDARDE